MIEVIRRSYFFKYATSRKEIELAKAYNKLEHEDDKYGYPLTGAIVGGTLGLIGGPVGALVGAGTGAGIGLGAYAIDDYFLNNSSPADHLDRKERSEFNKKTLKPIILGASTIMTPPGAGIGIGYLAHRYGKRSVDRLNRRAEVHAADAIRDAIIDDEIEKLTDEAEKRKRVDEVLKRLSESKGNA